MAVVRGASLRARLTRTLVGLGLVSVLLLATVNFFVVRGLIDDGTRDQLTTLRDMRRDAIELGVDRLLTRTSVLGYDAGIAASVAEFTAAFAELDDELTSEQMDTLAESYADVVRPYDDAGVPRPPVDELIPASNAGRYVQYEYIASQPAEQRAEVADAGDGSDYSAVHAERHDFLQGLAASVGADDLLLVSPDGDVVYSAAKNVDIGTNVADGPYVDTGLGASLAGLGDVGVRQAVISDSEYYLPSSTAPVVHVAAGVRSGAELIGTVVVMLETDVLTTLVTADQQWDQLGLGDTGGAYLVGPDMRLRTIPRPWFDDPDAYIERFLATEGDERLAGLMEFTGSPVLLQPVDNEAVRTALDGDEFIGTVDDYLGFETLSASAPIATGGLGWVVVTEQHTSEARDELERFVITIGILLGVLLPILALIGVVLARVLARPVRPLVDAAGRIADGDYRTEVPDLGPTELGDVGRQLEAVASQLRAQEASIEREEERITSMLSSVLPPALVDLVRRGERELGDVVDTGTVIALTLRGLPEASSSEQDVLVELVARDAEEFEGLVERHGVERARIAPELMIFVAGRGTPEYGSDDAAAFAADAIAAVERVGAELGLGLTAHGGLATGAVATGLLGSQQVAFGTWGDCVSRAIALSRVAGAGEVLADAEVLEQLGEHWTGAAATDDRGWGRPDSDTVVISSVDRSSVDV